MIFSIKHIKLSAGIPSPDQAFKKYDTTVWWASRSAILGTIRILLLTYCFKLNQDFSKSIIKENKHTWNSDNKYF